MVVAWLLHTIHGHFACKQNDQTLVCMTAIMTVKSFKMAFKITNLSLKHDRPTMSCHVYMQSSRDTILRAEMINAGLHPTY
jgi:hypothetical protein